MNTTNIIIVSVIILIIITIANLITSINRKEMFTIYQRRVDEIASYGY